MLNDPRIDERAYRLIENYESLSGFNPETGRYHPYRCEADPPGLMTIGRGRALHGGIRSLTVGGVTVDLYETGLTLDQVNQLYRETIEPRVKRVLARIPKALPHEYGALLSLFYNNEAALTTGTVDDLHNSGAPKTKVAAKILEYHYANKKPVRGLWRRRGTEALYYLTGELLIANSPQAEKAVFSRLASLGVKFKTPKF